MVRIQKYTATVKKIDVPKKMSKKMLKSMLREFVVIGTNHDIKLSQEAKTILKERLSNDINIMSIDKSNSSKSSRSSSSSDTVSGLRTCRTDSFTRSSEKLYKREKM